MTTPDTACLTAALPPGATALAVAYSGGRDSHVLLHLAVTAGLRVRALHVHHGLHPHADAWAAHCEAVARALGVPITVLPVCVAPAGEGEEAAARRARYAALAAALAPGELLATAHHADDQAETLLLRVLRGTGADGLAGIPPQRPLGAGLLVRPLLAVPAAGFAAYAEQQRLHWLEDPANRDPRHDRSWLRQQVMPAVAQRWPGLPGRMARLAESAREERALRERLLDERLRALAGEPPGPLPLAGLAVLPRNEVRALVRRWLRRDHRRPPPAPRLDAGLAALLGAAGDRQPAMIWADGAVCRHGGRLYRLPVVLPGLGPRSLATPPMVTAWPGLGSLRWQRLTGRGVAAAALADRRLRARAPAPGERFRPAGRPRRALKHWLREWGVPVWWRARLPLLEDATGEPVAVAGLAVAEGWQAAERADGWWPLWEPEIPSPAGDAGRFREAGGAR